MLGRGGVGRGIRIRWDELGVIELRLVLRVVFIVIDWGGMDIMVGVLIQGIPTQVSFIELLLCITHPCTKPWKYYSKKRRISTSSVKSPSIHLEIIFGFTIHLIFIPAPQSITSIPYEPSF